MSDNNNNKEMENAKKKAELEARARIEVEEEKKKEKERMKDIESEDIFDCIKNKNKIKLFKIKYNVLTKNEKILKDKMEKDDKKYLKSFKNLTTNSYDVQDESLYEGKMVKYNNSQVIISKVIKYKNGKTKYDIIYVTPKVIFEKGRYTKKKEEKKIYGENLKPIDIIHFIDCTNGDETDENIAIKIMKENRYFDFKRNTIKLRNKIGEFILIGRKGYDVEEEKIFEMKKSESKDKDSETSVIDIYTIYYEIIISKKKKRDFGKIDTWEIPYFMAKRKALDAINNVKIKFNANCVENKGKLKNQWNQIVGDVPIVRKMAFEGGGVKTHTKTKRKTHRKTHRKQRRNKYSRKTNNKKRKTHKRK